MLLFSEIDQIKTKNNAKSILKKYRFLSRVAGESYTPKVTATYSLEPRGGGFGGSKVDKQVLRRVDAWYELEAITEAYNRIIDPYVRHILHEKYMKWHNKRDYEIYTNLGYSETEYYRMLDRGLEEFAESYRNGKLLVFK